ncbi:hypothetical protein NEDG_01171 [Nematocida displodere]|uniref:Uncharacterized protein n=1 Tax=Nematocida displodere TaxID=1805483 RepID=A0A177ECZ2_9MICR|nr:hypothetical protein NEDG_01171 [Nematocida displodere]
MQHKRTVEDIDATIREMDNQYDANFGEWVRSEDNLDILATNLRGYLEEYTPETFAEVLKWITIKWKSSSRIFLLKLLFKEEVFKENHAASPKPTPRTNIILKRVIDTWTNAQISDFLIEFLNGMGREEKRVFLFVIVENFTHQQLTEIFIRIDSIVDWSLKISIIKKGMSYKGSST